MVRVSLLVMLAGCGGSSDQPTVDAGSSCPADYVAVGTSHYKNLGPLTYTTAKMTCAADLQHIMIVDTAGEAADVIIYLADPSQSLWAGVEAIGNNMFQTALGQPATYLPWDVDEPSTSAAGFCAVVEGSGFAAGSYFVDACSMTRAALCECD